MIKIIANAMLLAFPILALFFPRSILLGAGIALFAISDPYLGAAAFGLSLAVSAVGYTLTRPRAPLSVQRPALTISLCWIGVALLSLSRTDDIVLYVRDFFQLSFYLLLFLFVVVIAQESERSWLRIAIAIILGSTAMSILRDVEVITALELGGDPTGNYVNYWSIIGCLVLPLGLWSRTPRVLRPASVALVALAFITTQLNENRTGIVQAAFAGWLFIALHRRGWMAAGTIGAVAIATVLRVDALRQELNNALFNFSTLERLRLLNASMDLYRESPFVGHGLGSVTSLFLTDARIGTEIQYPHPHNAYAHYAVELGVLGLLILAAFLLPAMVRAFRIRASAANARIRAYANVAIVLTATILVEGLVEVLFYNAKLATVTMAAMGLVYALPTAASRSDAAASTDPKDLPPLTLFATTNSG